MKIGVVGSINMDLVIKTDRIPQKGETIIGNNLTDFPGGKGANQAVAISRLGESVTMFGCVGRDQYGECLIQNFKDEKVDASYVKEIDGVSTGIAVITVCEDDNSIIVIPGANNYVDKDYIDSIKDKILEHNLIILQNEIPMETIEYVVDFCNENKIKTILNPAPARKISKELIDKLSYLTPNEHEVDLIFGVENIDEVLSKYNQKLIITLGENGVKFANENKEIVQVPCRKSNVIDTTGAGDTFNGAFCVGLVHGKKLYGSIKFANIAAGLSTEKFGAQSGMPYLNEVLEEMGENCEN